jgi:hypothetical protein
VVIHHAPHRIQHRLADPIGVTLLARRVTALQDRRGMPKYANVNHGKMADDEIGIEVGVGVGVEVSVTEVYVEVGSLRSHIERAGG